VTTAALARAEATLGFALPPLLAALYLRIGDGGFGPDAGLWPLLDSPFADGPAAVPQYLANRESGPEDTNWPWPEGVLPIAYCCCGACVCVDCTTPEGTVLFFEANANGADQAWYVEEPGLAEWLRTWLDDTSGYDDAGGVKELVSWPDFRIRTAAAQAE
jgi:hypothetical protein